MHLWRNPSRAGQGTGFCRAANADSRKWQRDSPYPLTVNQLHIRWPVAIGSSATVPVVSGVLIAVVLRPVTLGLVVAVAFAVAVGSISVIRVRRRTLTVYDDALVVQRDKYRLVVPWSGVTAVQRRRHQRVMDVEELVCSGARVEAVDSRGRASRLPKGLEAHPALSRVMVSLYSEDWKSGPVGDKVRSAGVGI